ncbi:oxidoreductase [Phragmitibacter flavus]|uniref:Oxidoreductase n=1 Tax=Phragmitibacter flavus TaxID=2576071 RepID=A0A5R8KG29_9BACT|nr:aldo/keto reductase [Phragmitibacter flavus]TLD71243.1 oxidoreductase [Phragmitibacter flavus]
MSGYSRIIYGTWRLLDDPAAASSQSINARLNACVDAGITTIDTAEIYGLYEVEEALGRALALSPGLRDKLQLVSKCGIYVPCGYHPERKVAFYNATAARIVKSLEKSLRFLGTDRLDLMLVHRPDWLTSADDTAAGLNQMLAEGKIAAAGVSNYNVHQFELLNSRMEKPLVANQIEFHLLNQIPIHDGTLSQCERLGVLPMAWSPLGGGRLMSETDEAGLRVAEVAAELSPKYGGATLEQLAYAWILAHPSRPAVVIGTNKIERIAAAAQAVQIKLEREDWYRLCEAANGRPIP